MATPPDFVSGAVLTAAQMNAVGLWRNTTLTVSSAGGTAATVSDGVVTVGAGNTSVTLSSAFSADFANYKIIMSGVDLSSNGEALRLTLSSVTGTVYKTNIQYAAWGTGAFSSTGSTGISTGFLLGFGGTTDNTNISAEVFNPQIAKATGCLSQSSSESYWTTSGGLCTSTTQSTGFTITVDNGTMSGGIICVYGYNS